MLKNILIVVGLLLVGLGLYNAFVPQKILNFGPLEVTAQKGLATESLVLIIVGAVIVVAGAFIGNKKH